MTRRSLAFRLTLVGWLAFLGSGVFYLISSVSTRDWWAVAGAIVWIVGVVVFVTAAVLARRAAERSGGEV